MPDLPDGVVIVEIDDKDYDWRPCPKCGKCRWWWTHGTLRRGREQKCMTCDPPQGIAFRLVAIKNRLSRR